MPSTPTSAKLPKRPLTPSRDNAATDYETNFLRLLEKLTNGTRVEIGYTGTSLVYKPGVLVGGKVEHDCGTARAIGMAAVFARGAPPPLGPPSRGRAHADTPACSPVAAPY